MIPFGVVAVGLQPIYHAKPFLGAGVRSSRSATAGGPATDMLIPQPGRLFPRWRLRWEIARLLSCAGTATSVVGGSIREVVFRALYTEMQRPSRHRSAASRGGRVTFLNDAEAKAATETNRAQIGRAWELWKAQAMRAGGRG